MQATTGANEFNPMRWTALTWLAAILWGTAFINNIPRFGPWYTVDQITGEHSSPVYYKSLSELPMSVGWPLYYVTPRLFPAVSLATGSPPPRPLPAQVSMITLAVNVMLISSASLAMVYVVQKLRIRYSIKFLFALTTAVALNFAVARFLYINYGMRISYLYGCVIYFLPVAIALLVKWKVVKWPVISHFQWPALLPRVRTISNSVEAYSSADDAISAASKLDRRGDWTGSRSLYRQISLRWPEQSEYVDRCIKLLDVKLSEKH